VLLAGARRSRCVVPFGSAGAYARPCAPNIPLNRTARRRRSAPSARGRLAWFVRRPPPTMPVRTNTKRLAIAAIVGLAMTAISWAANSAASPLDPVVARLAGWVQLSELPAILIGAIFSGNVHRPSTVATYVALFLQWAGLAYVLSFAIAPYAKPQVVLRRWSDIAMNKLLPSHRRHGASE